MAVGPRVRTPTLTVTINKLRRQLWLTVVMVMCAVTASSMAADESGVVDFSATEKTMILSHGPWPPKVSPDSSNRFSGDKEAIAFGRLLFFDRRLAADGTMSCASCHLPERSMTDGLSRGMGREILDRNTPTVTNLANRRWYGWVGQADTLWGQSVRPLLDEREMANDAATLAELITADPALAGGYAQVTGRLPTSDSAKTILVNIAKMLAAWQETLVTPPTPFDRFRDALAKNRDISSAEFSPSARRGLKLFVGEARCSLCHFGPTFSNDEFHHIGLSHFIDDDRVDPGRHGGLTEYLQSPYGRNGMHSDEPAETASTAPGNFVSRSPDDWGRFRVPSLRNVAGTAPYMHDGSMPDLSSVIRHYNDIPLERLHSQSEALLQPLGLDEAQQQDIVTFLESLRGDPQVARPGIQP